MMKTHVHISAVIRGQYDVLKMSKPSHARCYCDSTFEGLLYHRV